MGRRILWLAVIGWFVSMFLPMDVSEGSIVNIKIGFDAMMASYDHQELFGFMRSMQGGLASEDSIGGLQMRWLRWAWFANVGAAIALIALFPKDKTLLKVLAFGGLLMFLLALAGAVLPLLDGKEIPTLGIAYWVWVGSLAVVVLGIVTRISEPAPE